MRNISVKNLNYLFIVKYNEYKTFDLVILFDLDIDLITFCYVHLVFTFGTIKSLVEKKQIKIIYFVLSTDNFCFLI